MASGQNRFTKNVRLNTGRLIRVEQQLSRLEKRIGAIETQSKTAGGKKATKKSTQPAPAPVTQATIARLEKKNAALEAEIAKLAAKVEANKVKLKEESKLLRSILALKEPVQALARGFKQTPGAPFSAWRTWMLSTFRKQGIYRKQLFK